MVLGAQFAMTVLAHQMPMLYAVLLATLEQDQLSPVLGMWFNHSGFGYSCLHNFVCVILRKLVIDTTST